MGVDATYLDAHCAVQGEHDAYATRAMLAFARLTIRFSPPRCAITEDDLGGFYRELLGLMAE